jgi:diaminohydroxyphosphoribosylaminopyrimidine deaminase/5-amino-6-(5-phosphoribosylamino)uracil reductase
VSCGLLEAEARRLNEDHFWSIVHGTPWVSLKLAMTWDGRIADARGASKWITSEQTRRFVHGVRRQHAGIAVGGATARADDPELTVRLVRGACPVRFVFSSTRPIPRVGRLAATAGRIRTVRVIDGGVGPSMRIDGSGIEMWQTGSKTRLAGMRTFLRMAHAEGITGILFEGGARMASFLMEHRLVNRLYLCYGNKIVGAGLDALTFARGLPIDACVSLDQPQVAVLGDNVVVTGIPLWRR